MKRFATLLLMLGLVFGLAVRPAQASAPAMSDMMAKMTQADRAAMPDCMAATDSAVTGDTAKDTGAGHMPCKCGTGGCTAMMAAGASFMPAADSAAFAPRSVGQRLGHPPVIAALHGRSSAPEPEPPALLG